MVLKMACPNWRVERQEAGLWLILEVISVVRDLQSNLMYNRSVRHTKTGRNHPKSPSYITFHIEEAADRT